MSGLKGSPPTHVIIAPPIDGGRWAELGVAWSNEKGISMRFHPYVDLNKVRDDGAYVLLREREVSTVSSARVRHLQKNGQPVPFTDEHATQALAPRVIEYGGYVHVDGAEPDVDDDDND